MNFSAAFCGLAKILHGADFHHFTGQRRLDGFNASVDNDAFFKAQKVRSAVTVNFEFKPGGKRVDAGNTDAV